MSRTGPLFADIGNSTIKVAHLVNERVECLSYTNHQNVPNELLSSIDLLSNVGLSITQQHEWFGNCPSVHDVLGRLPLSLAYARPKLLGQDRIAAMVGAWFYNTKTKDGKGSFAVIDLGSCVTIDIVDKEGKHLGGNIDLGVQWRIRAANTFSENLPMIAVDDNCGVVSGFLADNTQQALDYGIISGFLRQQVHNVKICFEQYGVQRVFLTGGQARWVNRFLPKQDFGEIIVDEDLVIRGLNDIFALD